MPEVGYFVKKMGYVAVALEAESPRRGGLIDLTLVRASWHHRMEWQESR